MTIKQARTNLGLQEGYAAASHTTDAETSGVFDLAPWTECTAAFSFQNHDDTGGDVSIKLQSAPTASGPWADVSGMSYTLPAISATETAAGWTFRASQTSRFVRAISTIPVASGWVGSMVWVASGPTGNRPSGGAFDWALDGATDITP